MELSKPWMQWSHQSIGEVQALLKLISVAKDVDIKMATETSALNKVWIKHLAWMLPLPPKKTKESESYWKQTAANISIPSSQPTWLGVSNKNISWELARATTRQQHGFFQQSMEGLNVNPSPWSVQGAFDIIAQRTVPDATKKLANDVLQRTHVWHNLISNRKVLYQCRQSPERLSVRDKYARYQQSVPTIRCRFLFI